MTNHKKVINLEGPEVWTFLECVYRSTRNRPLQEWYENKLSDDGRFQLDSLLKTNHKTKNHLEWTGFRKHLKGKAAKFGIWELGFKADGRQYRVFGIFGNVRRQAILLGGCYHKMGIYMPPNAINSACQMVIKIKAGGMDFHERKIATDI